MKERTETMYECDICEEIYAHVDDCKSCETSCKILAPISNVSAAFEDVVDNMNKMEKINLSNAIIEAVKESGAIPPLTVAETITEIIEGE